MKSARKLLVFAGFLMVPSFLWAQAKVANITINPAFLCPGQPVTVTYEAAAPDSTNQSLSLYVLAGFGAGAAPTINDNWFIHDSSNGGTPVSPIFSYTGYDQVVPTVDSFWNTYSVTTTVPAGYTTGQVVYVHVLAAEAYSSWGGPAASATTFTAAVTVNCNMGLVSNIGGVVFNFGGTAYTGASTSADLVINPCSSPTNTPTNTFTSTPTLSPTPTFTIGPTNTFTSTSTSTSTFTSTNTGTLSPTATSTSTFTSTYTPTVTNTSTNTLTFTSSFTSTNTFTPTNTGTPTFTFTHTFTPTNTFSPTPTIPEVDIFYVNKNLFNPASDKVVSILVEYSKFPGDYSLRIYNSAGEHIQTLDSKYIANGPISQSYQWDGTNKHGDACASGMYVLYLLEPFDRKLKRILLVR